MHLLFVDESGTPAKPGSHQERYFVLGGLIIPEERWQSVRKQLIGLKRQKRYYGEVKWRYFAPNNNDQKNPMLDWNENEKNDFRKSVFEIIAKDKSLRIIAGVCDASLAYNMGSVNDQEDIYFRTYKVITERFQYFLQDVSRESGRETSGIIVADHRNRHQDNIMREQHERLVRETKNEYTSTYKNFIESIFLSPSHMSIGIQLADMIAGAIWRFYGKNDDRWLNLIRSAFRTGRQGKIDGYGVARFPKTGWTGQIIY